MDKYYRWKAKMGLLKTYNLQEQEVIISKDYLTECIINRKQEFRRKELVELQDKLNEIQLFKKWLKSQKIF